MKKTKKQFAVKLWFDLGGTHTTVIEAFDKKEACNLAHKEATDKWGIDALTITSCRIKELPVCVIRSAFGHIPVKAEPNTHYDNEIIINNERISLPDEFRYWDIKSIVIHNAGLPIIATVTTDKSKFVVQNNINGCSKRFEIIK